MRRSRRDMALLGPPSAVYRISALTRRRASKSRTNEIKAGASSDSAARGGLNVPPQHHVMKKLPFVLNTKQLIRSSTV